MPFPFLAAAAPFIAAGVNAVGNMIGTKMQSNENMKMAQYQNEYNTPANQRRRYEDAGFNPNLAVTQGTSGNMSSPPQSADYQSVLANLGTQVQQARLLKSQADLNETKVDESGVKQDLMKAQESVAKANPWLNRSYVDSTVLQLQSAAKIKEQEAMVMTSYTKSGDRSGEFGMLKMQRELDILDQKYKLMQSDQKIKAEIFQSKEFQNDLLQIQRDWMKNADVTPQHIYQFIMMLLMKIR